MTKYTAGIRIMQLSVTLLSALLGTAWITGVPLNRSADACQTTTYYMLDVTGAANGTIKVTNGTKSYVIGGTQRKTISISSVACTVSITATANSGYRFKNWTGTFAGTSINNHYSGCVSANKTLSVVFENYSVQRTEIERTVTGGSMTVLTPVQTTYLTTDTVTLTANPVTGYHFAYWVNGSALVSTDRSFTTTAIAAKTVQPVFITDDKAAIALWVTPNLSQTKLNDVGYYQSKITGTITQGSTPWKVTAYIYERGRGSYFHIVPASGYTHKRWRTGSFVQLTDFEALAVSTVNDGKCTNLYSQLNATSNDFSRVLRPTRKGNGYIFESGVNVDGISLALSSSLHANGVDLKAVPQPNWSFSHWEDNAGNLLSTGRIINSNSVVVHADVDGNNKLDEDDWEWAWRAIVWNESIPASYDADVNNDGLLSGEDLHAVEEAKDAILPIAVFVPSAYYTLTLSASPTSGGTVITHRENNTYGDNEVATLDAQPKEGYVFARWQGGGISGNVSTSAAIPMHQNENVSAVFVPENTKPVISLLGDEVMNFVDGRNFSDPGVVATDYLNTDITDRVMVRRFLGEELNKWYIHYDVRDSRGVSATRVVRTVYSTVSLTKTGGMGDCIDSQNLQESYVIGEERWYTGDVDLTRCGGANECLRIRTQEIAACDDPINTVVLWRCLSPSEVAMPGDVSSGGNCAVEGESPEGEDSGVLQTCEGEASCMESGGKMLWVEAASSHTIVAEFFAGNSVTPTETARRKGELKVRVNAELGTNGSKIRIHIEREALLDFFVRFHDWAVVSQSKTTMPIAPDPDALKSGEGLPGETPDMNSYEDITSNAQFLHYRALYKGGYIEDLPGLVGGILQFAQSLLGAVFNAIESLFAGECNDPYDYKADPDLCGNVIYTKQSSDGCKYVFEAVPQAGATFSHWELGANLNYGTEAKITLGMPFGRPTLIAKFRCDETQVKPEHPAIPAEQEPEFKSDPNCITRDAIDSENIDPVNLYSGEFYEEATDIAIPGDEIDFVWSRKYKSRLNAVEDPAVDTAMGRYWDHHYNIFLKKAYTDGRNADLILYGGLHHRQYLVGLDAGGARVTAAPRQWRANDAFFSLAPSSGAAARLDLQCPNGELWTFEDPFGASPVAGKLVSIKSKNGNTLSFRYDSSGRLDYVLDTRSNKIEIEYCTADTRSKIRQVNVFGYNSQYVLRKSILYTYYASGENGGSAGDLKAVYECAVPVASSPNLELWRYTYDEDGEDNALNGNLLEVLKEGVLRVRNHYGNLTSSVAEDYDRVAMQEWGDAGHIVNFTYKFGLTAGNKEVSRTIVNDRKGNVTEYYFDSNNLMTRRRLFRDPAPSADSPTYGNELGGNLNQNRPGTEANYYETRYEWNEHGRLARITYPSGRSLRYYYDVTNGLARGNVRTVKEFGAANNELTSRSFSYDTGCTCNRVTSVTDAENKTITIKYVDSASGYQKEIIPRGGTAGSGRNHLYVYDPKGKCIRHEYPRDESGYAQKDTYSWTRSAWKLGDETQATKKQRVVILQDSTGSKVKHTVYFDMLGKPVGIDVVENPASDADKAKGTFFKYDSYGRVIEERTYTGAPPGNTSCFPYVRKSIDYEPSSNMLAALSIFDGTGTLSQPVLTLRSKSEFVYDSLGYMLTESFTRNAGGVEHITNSYLYDENRNVTKIQLGQANADAAPDPDNIIEFTYNTRDLPVTMKRGGSAAGALESLYEYDADGNLTSITPGGDSSREVKFAYDGLGRVEKVIRPLSAETWYSYDRNSRIRTITNIGRKDPSATEASVLSHTENIYDALGRNTEIRELMLSGLAGEPLPAKPATPAAAAQLLRNDAYPHANTVIGYNWNSQILNVGNTGNPDAALTFGYDTLNRLKTVTDAAGNVETREYDTNSFLSKVTQVGVDDDPASTASITSTVEYKRDTLGRAYEVKFNGLDAEKHLYEFDALGNVIKYTAPGKDGFPDTGAYDGLGRLVKRSSRLSASAPAIEVNYTWDDSSRLTAVTDPTGLKTTYKYDALNRLTSVWLANNTTTTGPYRQYAYDAGTGDLVTIKDVRGTTTTLTHDALGRMTSRSDSNPAQAVKKVGTETFGYDGLNRLLSAAAVDYTNSNTWTASAAYDTLSNRISDTASTTPPGASTPTVVVGAAIAANALGQVSGLTYPWPPGSDAPDLAFTYDSANRLDEIFGTALNDADASSMTHEYLGPDRTLKTTIPLSSTKTLNAQFNWATGTTKRLVDVTQYASEGAVNTTLLKHDYQWDNLGRMTARQDNKNLGGFSDHTFAYDSLDRLTKSPRTSSYAYNNAGDRTPVTLGTFPHSYAVWGGLSYTQDANGNILTSGSGATQKKYTFDSHNRLISSQIGSGTITQYVYDAFGRRVKKVAGSTVTNFYYAGDQLIEERDGNGNVTATYAYDGATDNILCMTTYHTTTGLLGAVKMRYYFLKDAQGNVSALTDDNGTVLERYDYGDFGKVFVYNDAGTLLSTAPTAPFLFNGYRYDAESGLYYLRNRYLDPEAGRFLTPDPLGPWFDALNWGNPYTYVGNNPWNMTDPFGLSGWEDVINPNSRAEIRNGLGGYSLIAGGPENEFLNEVNSVMNPIGCMGLGLMNGDLGAVQTGLDLLGIVDPTGTADATNAVLYAAHGDWGDAGISGLSAFGADFTKSLRYAGGAGLMMGGLKEINDAGGIINKGGRFADLTKLRREGEVAHHMPQDAFNNLIGLPRSNGPALGMAQADHLQTRTYGWRGAMTVQSDFGLGARQRLALDLLDIHRLFGRRYNKGSLELLEYVDSLKEFE